MKITDFINNIGIPEFNSIIGKRGSKMFLLIGLLFISLIAIGIAQGGIIYLKEKMNDPFVKFIDIENSISQIEKANNEYFPVFSFEEAEKIAKDSTYGVDPLVSKTRTNYLELCYDKNLFQFKGIILKQTNKFYQTLSDKKMFTTANVFIDTGWGIVITKDLVKKLDIPAETPYIKMLLDYNNEYDSLITDTIPIPISGIVEDLKNNADFIMTDKLFNAIRNRDKVLRSNKHQDYLCFFMKDMTSLSIELKKNGFSVLNDIEQKSYLSGIIIQSNNINIEFPLNSIKVYDLNKFTTQVKDKKTQLVKPDYFTFYLNELDKVKYLADSLKSKYGIEIEQTKLESKKNLDFFEKLSKLLSNSIILFSILSMIIFITNLVLSHINSNKKNLGTLQAFGLSNNYIVILYTSISFILVLISFLTSFILSEFVGNGIIDLYISFNSINNEYLDMLEFSSLKLIHMMMYLVVIPTIVIILAVVRYLYNKTPGDLIYERK